jgi:hypothetical protein
MELASDRPAPYGTIRVNNGEIGAFARNALPRLVPNQRRFYLDQDKRGPSDDANL